MFICANCGVTNFADISQAMKNKGDWVIICSACCAENILVQVLVSSFQFSRLEVVGYRET